MILYFFFKQHLLKMLVLEQSPWVIYEAVSRMLNIDETLSLYKLSHNLGSHVACSVQTSNVSSKLLDLLDLCQNIRASEISVAHSDCFIVFDCRLSSP